MAPPVTAAQSGLPAALQTLCFAVLLNADPELAAAYRTAVVILSVVLSYLLCYHSTASTSLSGCDDHTQTAH